MYRKHLKIQKYICLLCVIAAAVSFVYALGMITDIYDALYAAVNMKGDPSKDKVAGAHIYLDMQAFNKQFVNVSIVLVLLACFLFVTNTHSRRKYYLSNYIAVGAYGIATLGVGFWAHANIEKFAAQYMETIDFEGLLAWSQKRKTLYLDNTDLLDLHRWVLVLAVVSVVALIGNLIWKIILVRKENALIEAGKEAA